MKKKSFMKNKKSVIYAKKNFVLIKIIKKNLNYTIELEIIVIIQENIEELLIVFVIYVINTKRDSCSIS